MSLKQKNIIVILLTILSISLVYIWFYPLNKGVLSVNTGMDNYELQINNESIICDKDPCNIKLKSGSHTIHFTKEKHYAVTKTIIINRNKITGLKLNPKKIIVFKKTNIIPETHNKPLSKPKINEDEILASVWNKDKNKLLFLSKTDNYLQIYQKDKDNKIITILKNLENPELYWSNDEEKIVAIEANSIYFIETINGGRKKKESNIEITNIIWPEQSSYLLLNNKDNELFKIAWTNKEETKKVSEDINLKQGTWINKNEFLYFNTNKEKNISTISVYNLENEIKTELITKNIIVDRLKYDKEKRLGYFYCPEEGEWYEIEI